ncbi:unnamed protein product [Durusdinium trenchii]|uniref:Uncharacterized protein n=1 Tax=Durusdinium trenchii TaxID=1381693 RepID=A0ABP0SMM0_9DINO
MAAGAPPSPRFESDKEDGEESKSRKLVFDGIDAASKCDGVDVDKRMLDGRKANRGFTISTGTSADPDFSSLRNSKRAQTLPADCSRRRCPRGEGRPKGGAALAVGFRVSLSSPSTVVLNPKPSAIAVPATVDLTLLGGIGDTALKLSCIS